METRVLKLGGGQGNDHSGTLRNLAERIRGGERWILVHGASDAANKLAEEVGYPPQIITTASGHTSRYTDARTIQIYSMAAASVNQSMTAALTGLGVNVVGLAGPNILRAQRKAAIRAVRDGRTIMIRDDHTGAINQVNWTLLANLLDAGYTPVVAPLAMGDQFEPLNVDGDLAAAWIARSLSAETLTILSNVPGLLRDISDPSSLITRFSLSEIPTYEPVAAGRMKKKLMAAQVAEVPRVILADSRVEAPLDSALRGGGTWIVRDGIAIH